MTTATSEKYVLDRRLGGGGMAEVFLARTVGAEGFSRPVAIKRVLPGYSENPQFASMFVTEARLSSRLQHPNIVSVLDFDRDRNGQLYLVMELVDGVDLDGLIATGPLPYAVIAYVTAEILRGLGHAHDLPVSGDGIRGVVHRDVSPHNVLLSWAGAVKVSDFGIAKARAASNATATELVKGKPAYMSPEQANGEHLDGRSDLFAVGVMLWELLCARPLFAGMTTQETLARLLFAPVAPPRSLRPDVPAALERVAMLLLARDREQRYQTAESAITDLVSAPDYPRDGRALLASVLVERCPDRAPKHARDLASPEAATRVSHPKFAPVHVPHTPIPGPSDAVAADVARYAQTRPTPGRRRPWIAVLAVLVLAGAVTGGVLALRGTGAPAGSGRPPDDASRALIPLPDAAAIDALSRDAAWLDGVVADAPTELIAPDAAPPDAKPAKGSRRAKSGSTGSGGMEEVNLGGD